MKILNLIFSIGGLIGLIACFLGFIKTDDWKYGIMYLIWMMIFVGVYAINWGRAFYKKRINDDTPNHPPN